MGRAVATYTHSTHVITNPRKFYTRTHAHTYTHTHAQQPLPLFKGNYTAVIAGSINERGNLTKFIRVTGL